MKHAFSDLALRALEDPSAAPAVAALRGFCQASAGEGSALLEAVSQAAGLSPEEARRALLETGLFVEVNATVALGPPYRACEAYLCRQVDRLEEAVGALRRAEPPGVPGDVWRGAVLFNAGLFFESHEYWEGVWRAAPEPDRTFYHGLVQAAAGCYHLERGNLHGARTLLSKAAVKLGPYAPAHLGVDVASLLEALDRLRAAPAPGGARGLRIAFIEDEGGRRRRGDLQESSP